MLKLCLFCRKPHERRARPWESNGEPFDYEAEFDKQLRRLPVRVQVQLPWDFGIGFASNESCARIGLPASRCGVSLVIVVPDGGEFTDEHMNRVRAVCGGLINIVVTVKAGERGTIMGRLFDRTQASRGAGVCEV
jgi:hypothetical protein